MTGLDDWCSINEAARRLGVTPTAIRNRIKRHTLETKPHGNFGRLVRVPLMVPGTVTETVPETVTLTVPPQDGGEGKALREHVQTLRDELVAVRAEYAEALERERVRADRAEEQAANARQEVREARERADGMFDRLAALERDLGVTQGERDRLRVEVEQARRPWWRHWRR